MTSFDVSITGPGFDLHPDRLTIGGLTVMHPGPLTRPSVFPGGRFPRQGRGQLLVQCEQTGCCLYRDRHTSFGGVDRYVMVPSEGVQQTLEFAEPMAEWFRQQLRMWAPGTQYRQASAAPSPRGSVFPSI